jgi:hypothetical protein
MAVLIVIPGLREAQNPESIFKLSDRQRPEYKRNPSS